MSPQGKKGNPAAAAARGKPAPPPKSHRRLGLIVFAALFLCLFVLVGVAVGIGKPSVPDGAIAVVEEAPDGTITSEQFDRALVQAAARQGLKEVPPEDDPQFDLLADAAEGDLILSRWVLGEAEERGIEVTEREIDDELETIKEQQFGSEKAFEKFLEDSGFTLDEAKQRIQLQLVSDAIQQAVLPEEPAVEDDEIEAFYDANISQFEQPETRDVRVVLAKDEADADKALADLGTDPDAQTWEQVAKDYSIDEATAATGGLREAVVAGQSEPALDEAIFAAAEGELEGPFEGDAGFYVIQVESITPATTRGLDDEIQPAAGDAPAQTVADQIRATLLRPASRSSPRPSRRTSRPSGSRARSAPRATASTAAPTPTRRPTRAPRRSPRPRAATRPCPRPGRSSPAPTRCSGRRRPPGSRRDR